MSSDEFYLALVPLFNTKGAKQKTCACGIVSRFPVCTECRRVKERALWRKYAARKKAAVA